MAFNRESLAEKIEDLAANRLDPDSFEEWFIAESWGHYGGPESRAIAAVHHVLHHMDEMDHGQLVAELRRSSEGK